jgi:hypothetical protein
MIDLASTLTHHIAAAPTGEQGRLGNLCQRRSQLGMYGQRRLGIQRLRSQVGWHLQCHVSAMMYFVHVKPPILPSTQPLHMNRPHVHPRSSNSRNDRFILEICEFLIICGSQIIRAGLALSREVR